MHVYVIHFMHNRLKKIKEYSFELSIMLQHLQKDKKNKVTQIRGI